MFLKVSTMDINKRFAPPGISPRKEPTQKMRIYASTFSGATEDRLLKETFGRRSLCFAAASGAAEHFAARGAVLRKNRALREGCARRLCGVSF